jgi:hypothetical protein
MLLILRTASILARDRTSLIVNLLDKLRLTCLCRPQSATRSGGPINLKPRAVNLWILGIVTALDIILRSQRCLRIWRTQTVVSIGTRSPCEASASSGTMKFSKPQNQPQERHASS